MAFKCGLLGEKLSHSRSPEIHRTLGAYEYLLYEKSPAEVEDFLINGVWDVLNVTIPYKKTAFELCSETSEIAKRLENVNVVVKRFDGTIYGDNTDAGGFAALVKKTAVSVKGKKCIVLGAGGAGSTAKAVLEELGAESVITVSRNGEDNYGNIDRHKDAQILVNATPVGMYPNVESSPVELSKFNSLEAVIDLIYNPSPTKLLSEAMRLNIPAAGGEVMLLEQAKKASVYMNANIYLYGAPGSGKSTYAKRLALEKSMPLIDLDEEIQAREKMSIPEIFAEQGEKKFREIEKEELIRVSRLKNHIVALGGGALLDDESRAIAQSTGRVVFIDCGKEELMRRVKLSSQRPLLSGDAQEKLERLLDERAEHYLSFKERIRL